MPKCQRTIYSGSRPLSANRTKRSGYRFVVKNGTLTVQSSASEDFTKLRSTLVITLATAYFTYAKLLPVSIDLQRSQATHNPLVHGSSPCGPTNSKAAHCAAFAFLAQ